jgi:hypothetical protein
MKLAKTLLILSFIILQTQYAWAAEDSKPKVAPKGSEKSAKTSVLETGAKILQDNAPVAGMDIYLVGFHPMKDHPDQQMEAHHFCKQVNEDFAQCVLFDGNTASANLNGIEYIISEKLFEKLPKKERAYWHPHNYEILSGQLIAPGLPDVAEKELMRTKVNSYGKTWHVWNTGHFGGKDGDTLPLGEPMLAWSFNRDKEANPGMVEATEKKFQFKVMEKRRDRSDLKGLAKPQEGVDDLKKSFAGPLKDLPGVMNK